MTRRESVRVLVFARGSLIGSDRAIRCALVNVSASGAMVSFTGRVPEPPLRLEFAINDVEFAFPVEIVRVAADGGLVLSFPRPHSEALYHQLAVEQRRALAHHRVNISERRVPPSFAPRGITTPPEADARSATDS